MGEIRIEPGDKDAFDKIYKFMDDAQTHGHDVHIVMKEGTISIDTSALGEIKEWFLIGHGQDRVDKINSGEISIDTSDLRKKTTIGRVTNNGK